MVDSIKNRHTITSIEQDSLKSWLRLILLFTIGVVGTVGMWSVVVVMPAIETEFNIDRGKASLLYATTMVGFGLGNFLIGKVIDRFGPDGLSLLIKDLSLRASKFQSGFIYQYAFMILIGLSALLTFLILY